jgi:tetratricopeptide (TPR) repeat protein
MWVSRLWGLALCLWSSLAGARAGDGDAIAALDDKLAQDPERIEWLMERAALHRLGGDFGAALADLNEVYDLDPELPEACLERGQVLAALGYPLAAESDLGLFLAYRPDSARALAVRGRMLALMGRPTAARADYEAALALVPTSELYLDLCRLDEAAGDLDGAASCYTRGLGELHEALVLRHALARIETGRRNYGRAIDLLDTLIDHPALRAGALLDRADAYEEAGKEGKALRDRQLALREIDRTLVAGSSGRFRQLRVRALSALDGEANGEDSGEADGEADGEEDERPPQLDRARAALRHAREHR